MKSLIPYVIVFSVSLLLVTAVMAGLIKFSPGILGFNTGSGVPADSTHRPGADSIAAAASVAKGRDTTAAEAVKTVQPDTARPEAENREKQPEKTPGETSVQSEQPKQAAVVDTTVVKKQQEIAKYFDSMNAESAAKILNSMTDDEIKGVLAKVKKRQAAKILTLIEPSRAVRVLR
jgi:flagellar motility protein MotE (MotC chaperone)